MDKRTAKIKALHDKGLSFSEIGARMNMTRSAVSGVMWRNGWCAKTTKSCKPGPTKTPQYMIDLVLKTAKKQGVKAAAQAWGFHPITVYNWRKSLSA